MKTSILCAAAILAASLSSPVLAHGAGKACALARASDPNATCSSGHRVKRDRTEARAEKRAGRLATKRHG